MSRICKPLRIGSKLQCVKKYIANATIAKTFDLIESLSSVMPDKKRSVLERLFLRKKGKRGQGNVHLFFLGSGSASQVIRTSFFRKALSSNRSTRSIGFPPS